MKKFILSLVTSMMLVVSANAQLIPSLKFGVKGALNFSSLKSEGKWLNSDTKTGYQAGLWARVGAAGFHVQPEAYFTGKKIKGEYQTENGSTENGTFDLTTIDVPVLLGTRVGLGPIGVRFQAGPVFAFKVSEGGSLSKYTDFANYKKASTGIIGGIGADITKFTVDLRYEHGLSSLSDNKDKIKMWSIGVGYNFL
ncbi:porin family protein [Sphingobacterium spiritivorum]|uniref:porin family protein n=1 Tax=Sphingobacterium spiritivorum TaxID=258 RepID=UPI003DA48402